MSFYRDMLLGVWEEGIHGFSDGMVTSLEWHDTSCQVYDFVRLAVWIVRCYYVIKKQVLYSRMIVVILQLQLAIWKTRLHI